MIGASLAHIIYHIAQLFFSSDICESHISEDEEKISNAI